MSDLDHESLKTAKPKIEDWIQVAATHYDPVNYLQPARMASIGYQFRLIHEHFPNARILEIGAGAGLTASILRQLGHEVHVMDIEEKLNPNIHGSVTEIPLPDRSYDAFLCCQVLEHLPWKDALVALRELARVVKYGGVISVPTMRPSIGIAMHVGKRLGTRRITLPMFRTPTVLCSEYHYWELCAGVTEKELIDGMKQAGLTVIVEFQPVLNLYHHFFVLEKNSL